MSLAQIVYQISTDARFAEQWQADPEEVLEREGITLSREEFDFLLNGLRRGELRQVPVNALPEASWKGV